jgi:hypothetical protein
MQNDFGHARYHETFQLQMNKILTLLACLAASLSTFAQDTTWVQTYTFDTISTRRATFEFPASLDDQRFEKVLMYYKLKCSPLTTWDQYDCGEWDYLTYTRIFDHTGAYDSVQVDGMRYRINTLSPASASFRNNAFYDKRWKAVSNASAASSSQHTIGTPGASSFPLLQSDNNGALMQWVVTGSELAAAGVTTGGLNGLKLDFPAGFSKLEGVRIRIKHTSQTSLSSWETTGFTTVYDNQLENIAAGTADLWFSAPFAWDGASNIVIEISVSDANQDDVSSVIAMQPSAGTSLVYSGANSVFAPSGSNHAELNLSGVDMGGDLTIAFWAQGNNMFGTSSTILEAVDSVDNRILNIHFPWSDNNIYWDAGNLNGYDRINKVVTAADVNSWHHWAFVKKTSTGQMFIYRDGVLFHSGSNLNRPVGKIDRIFLGSSWNQGNHFAGNIDEFSIWTAALDASTISQWYSQKISGAHPNYASLELYYSFDDVRTLIDRSGNNRLGMPSQTGMTVPSAYPVAGAAAASERPYISVLQGTMNANEQDSVLTTVFPVPSVLFEYAAGDNSFVITGNSVIYPQATIDTMNVAGNVIGSAGSGSDETISNEQITYFEEPFELVNDVEIGRYITPYGIQFDLGPNGFTWIYDVTDYQKYLHGMVDLAAHNTQELIDLKFAFIEGIPPRDVHNVEPIWENWRSYNYGNLAQNTELTPQTITLSDTSSMFKIKTRLSGHGQVGQAACCEWVPNDHKIYINGTERFVWNIWQTSECGENPNTSQGGTWPYAREGWCPGDMVKEHDHEITPFVAPGQTITVDYGITPVPGNDPGQAGGNYIGAFDLVSYSEPNFQHDAAIVDILNPSSYEYYGKFNPSCSSPRVILQNTGAQPLTACTIRIWANYGTWQEYQWTGNLGFLEKEIIEIPITLENFWFGTSAENPVFTAQVFAVGGSWPDLDEYANNNVFRTPFGLPESIYGPFYVMFNTNNKASENKWKLIDDTGSVIFERTSLTNSTQYKDTFDLAPGCYSVILEDSDNDGIGFWYSSQVEGETSGQFRLRKVGGGYIEYFPADFGAYHRFNFSVGFTLGTEENGKPDEKLFIYPNPAANSVRAEWNGYAGSDARASVTDAKGRVLKTTDAVSEGSFISADIDISGLEAGMYFLRISGSRGTRTGQFIKQ